MRKPTYLSHSSLTLWGKDKEEFYIKHLSETRAPRIAQQNYMAVGAAFDAYAKSALHERLFGKGADSQFEFQTIFEAQVESHNRDFALEAGQLRDLRGKAQDGNAIALTSELTSADMSISK